MKKNCKLIIGSIFLFSALLNAQPVKQNYHLDTEKVLYTVGYAHLDTEWNWDYPTTIQEYIRNIMTENFYLFEKYPDYVFNFTGSRRYEMMKEYYPDLYPKVADYIRKGRWFVSGSSVDEGEVNISSSESIIRQVLYGNRFFKTEFGKTSADYMLPDCFGFLANLPSIWNHCGLLGFSTQKLTWRSANGVPFNVGVWNGPDGKGIIAALNATSYTSNVNPRLDQDKYWINRLDENIKKYGISFDFRYYGVGDQGGAPRERDVFNAVGSLNNQDSQIKVLLCPSDQMFKDITPDIRKKLPVYTGDLLLIEHSAGSMTSQAYMKKLNRKNELLAQAAEQLASISDLKGLTPYPYTKLNNGWNLVLGSQFHDILPGTSIPKAYEYAWNDEFIAANNFAEVLKNSLANLSGNMNTEVKGRAVIVYNPVASAREDIVNVELEYQNTPRALQVFDVTGKALPTQTISQSGKKIRIIFPASVPSMGLAVFDIRESDPVKTTSSLKISNHTLENDFYKISISAKGDITSIWDKKISKELLSQPARLEFLHEAPAEWPAWNMDWNDRQKPVLGYMDQDAQISIAENGPVRIALEIKRKGWNSEIDQIISLSAGSSGQRIEITNHVDWQSRGVSLKASFPLTASNPSATYNLGAGTISRTNNSEVKFEVPSKEWFDLTDKSKNYGVTILEDCKYGSDKPSDQTLRLTLLYTPEAHSFKYQNSQDWGIHSFKYGIYSHKGTWQDGLSPWQGKSFNQPLLAFETTRHSGNWGKQISLLSTSSPQIGLMALKKMEDDHYLIVRVNELLGQDLKEGHITFPANIEDAYEVNGQEQKIGNARFKDNKLSFGLTHYTIRSFAVKLKPEQSQKQVKQILLSLPFNKDVFSFDTNRDDGEFSDRSNYPAEQIPDTITSEGIQFKIGDRNDRENNAVRCDGQEIQIPEGKFKTIYLLAAATKDTLADFQINNQSFPVKIQKWSGYIGQFYNREFAKDGITVTAVDSPFAMQDNIAWYCSHRHHTYPSSNEAYHYCYIFKYRISLPEGSKTIRLPKNNAVRIFAVTLSEDQKEIHPLQPLYDNFNNSKPFILRDLNQ